MHVLTWLKERGSITDSQYEAALNHARRNSIRAEEALLEVRAFTEADLLKTLAARYATQFVSTDRLASAGITREILARVPAKVAEQLQVFPVVFDARHQRLSVVVAAPGEDDVEKQVQVVSGVREVRALVGRPAAIAAAVARSYFGDRRAFDAVRSFDQEVTPEATALDLYDTHVLDLAPPAPDTGDLFKTSPERRAEPAPGRVTPSSVPLPPSLDGPVPLEPPPAPESVDFEGYLAMLGVFVGLLERDRGELRGHSAHVVRLCRSVAERVGMSEPDRRALLTAAYLHDVGKGSATYHLTALNVAKFDGHRSQANKSLLAPAKLFEGAWLPEQTGRILAHMYERFDGQGFPDRLAGKDIPYGARVLSIVETYCDLIANPQNPYRRLLSASQAVSVIRELGGSLFDPTLAELLIRLAIGEHQRDAQGDRPRALVVDPDPEETTVLEMRLIAQGFVVRVARDVASALKQLKASPADVVVSEVDFGAGPDGFELLDGVQTLPEDGRPEVIFLTTRSDRDTVTRVFDRGAVDFLLKPAAAEVVAAKATQAVEGKMRKRVGGVSGSLKEMSLPDVVQILSNGRRSGKLQLVSGSQRGEIHFADGQIVDAKLGKHQAEEAVYALLRLADGTFSLDPTFKPGARRINTSAEGLLLEGMRRLDEDIR